MILGIVLWLLCAHICAHTHTHMRRKTGMGETKRLKIEHSGDHFLKMAKRRGQNSQWLPEAAAEINWKWPRRASERWDALGLRSGKRGMLRTEAQVPRTGPFTEGESYKCLRSSGTRK